MMNNSNIKIVVSNENNHEIYRESNDDDDHQFSVDNDITLIKSKKLNNCEINRNYLKDNLKIVVNNDKKNLSASNTSDTNNNNNNNSNNNNNNCESNDIELELEADTTVIDQNNDNEKITSLNDFSEKTNGVEDDTEFHVNLDKAPDSLNKNPLNVKLYINKNQSDERIDDEKSVDNVDLKQLYESLNVDESSFDYVKNRDEAFRKDALHLFGVDDMNTDDVFEYFKGYSPYAIEWINDTSCNVVWKNDALAALALIEISKPLSKNNKEITEEEEEEKEKEKELGEIEEKIDGDGERGEDKSEDGDDKKSERVKNDSEKVPPMEHRWRMGIKSKKGNVIYMRFAKKLDKKSKGAEAKSRYYAKYGNPNYGFIKGFISSSKRQKMKQVFFNHNEKDGEDLNDSIREETNSVSDSNEEKDDIVKRLGTSQDGKGVKRKMRMYADDLSEKKSERLSAKVMRKTNDARSLIDKKRSKQ